MQESDVHAELVRKPERETPVGELTSIKKNGYPCNRPWRLVGL
jgi:hypothetical protein